MLTINPESKDSRYQRINEQAYFFDMFEEMWGPPGEILTDDVQYSLCEELKALERERITNALKLFSGNQTKAAHALNVGRTALIAKMRKYNIT